MEIVISDPTGTRLDVSWREPQHEALRAASDTERRVVDARRRRLVYPYEIIAMLTTPGGDLPAGGFEEYELAPGERRRAQCRYAAARRQSQRSGVRRDRHARRGDRRGVAPRPAALDPTRDMGALAAPECDRIVAAIDLAERLAFPSNGCRVELRAHRHGAAAPRST